MLIEVKVPVLPESITEATLVNWHKKAGDAVKRDENLVDVETDKIVLELPAPASGIVTEIRKAEGATVGAQEVIAVIDTDAKGAAPGEAAATAPAAAPAAASAPAVTAAPQAAAGALPAARKLMAEQNLTPGDVAGTGRGGRITKGDVLAAVGAKRDGGKSESVPAAARAPAPTPLQAPAVQLPPAWGTPPEQRGPMSRPRQR